MNNKGLSLIEILIAATILTFVSFGIVQVTDNSFKTKDMVINEDREFLQVETAMTRIQEDISQMYTPLYFSSKAPPAPLEVEAFSRYEGGVSFTSVNTLGHPIPNFQNPDRYTFEFFTFSNRRRMEDLKQSIFAWVKYTLRTKDGRTANSKEKKSSSEKDAESELANKSPKGLYDLIRAYTPDDPFALEKRDWEKIKQFVLLPNVTSFEFLFWDENKKKFIDTLNDLPKEYILRAVKVKFSWISRSGAEYSDERIFKSIWPYIKFKKAGEDNKTKTTKKKTGGIDNMGGATDSTAVGTEGAAEGNPGNPDNPTGSTTGTGTSTSSTTTGPTSSSDKSADDVEEVE